MKLLEKLHWAKDTQTNWVQTILRLLLGAALLFAGISHLTFNRQEFVAQVPLWVPMSTDLVVILSGIAEIALGLALLVLYKWKAAAGWAAAIFFVLIFPGNISQYVNEVSAFGLDTDQARFIRLFFQPVLIAWAIYSTGAWKAFKNRNK